MPGAVIAAGAAAVALLLWRRLRARAPQSEQSSGGADDVAASPTGDDEQFGKAVTLVRDTAKWVIASFGAIGAALVLGVQLSDLSDVDPTSRDLAAATIVIGLLGVGLAVFGVSGLLLPRDWTLEEIAKKRPGEEPRRILDESPRLMAPFASVEELSRAVAADQLAYRNAYLGYYADPPTVDVKALNAAADRASSSAESSRYAMNWANYGALMADYRRMIRRWVFPGLAAAVGGLLAFVFITHPSPAPSTATRLSGLDLSGRVLNEARLAGARMEGTRLNEAHLVRVDLTGANLKNAVLTGADLSGANLRGADLSGAQLDGVIWAGTTCPDGVISDAVGGTCVAHLTIPKPESSLMSARS